MDFAKQSNPIEQSTPKATNANVGNSAVFDLPEVDSSFTLKVDLDQFKGKLNSIVEVQGLKGELRVPSPNAKAPDGKSHVLKFVGEVVHTEVINGRPIEFRPSELISLVEDDLGNLLGLPKNEQSNWQILKHYLKINRPQDAIGKQLPMTVSKKGYLGYMYK